MSTPTSITLEMQGGLAVVTLAQGPRGNPFDGDFTRDFKTIAAELWNRQDDGALRAVLLRADGANFSYGGDLKSFHPVRDRLGPLVREWTGNLHMGLQRFWQLPVPVVVAVQGFAMGGGVALLAGADVVVAAESARFGSAFAQLGFSCDSGSSVTLTARMGPARARRFVMLAEVLSSADALQAGLVDRVVADDKLQSEAAAMAQRLAEGPTLALGEVKRLFMRAGAAHLTAQLEDEALTLSRVAGSADAQEGIAAMVERRKPVFKGC
jgi:2-(1,2-epoxy-1,2-dihydrophenyl)acetyl-CoA isomerase